MCVMSLFILFLVLKIRFCRTPETNLPNPWSAIEPSLRTTALTSSG